MALKGRSQLFSLPPSLGVVFSLCFLTFAMCPSLTPLPRQVQELNCPLTLWPFQFSLCWLIPRLAAAPQLSAFSRWAACAPFSPGSGPQSLLYLSVLL